MSSNFDLRKAVNSISDVVANRPAPLREFDQIHMKVADMVIQAHFISERFADKDVIFIGDGDAIGLSIMHLGHSKVFDSMPKSIHVLDFDERVVNSINRFAQKYGFQDQMSSSRYNVIDALPDDFFAKFDAFYTNPPWGASNGGESVKIFLERGIEALKPTLGEGVIVIADDPETPWTQEVLHASQKCASDAGFLVSEMIPQLHLYHLDDAPELKSCSCMFRRAFPSLSANKSKPIEQSRLDNFYGKLAPLRVHYVEAVATLNYGKACESTYKLIPVGEKTYE